MKEMLLFLALKTPKFAETAPCRILRIAFRTPRGEFFFPHVRPRVWISFLLFATWTTSTATATSRSPHMCTNDGTAKKNHLRSWQSTGLDPHRKMGLRGGNVAAATESSYCYLLQMYVLQSHWRSLLIGSACCRLSVVGKFDGNSGAFWGSKAVPHCSEHSGVQNQKCCIQAVLTLCRLGLQWELDSHCTKSLWWPDDGSRFHFHVRSFPAN